MASAGTKPVEGICSGTSSNLERQPSGFWATDTSSATFSKARKQRFRGQMRSADNHIVRSNSTAAFPWNPMAFHFDANDLSS